MKTARVTVLVLGILLPYLARIPGTLLHGSEWLTSYFSGGFGAFVFFGLFNAICWSAVLAASISYRRPSSIFFPAIGGFGFLTIVHGYLDLSSSSTAAVSLLFVPIYSLPFVLIGWLVGLWFDRRISENAHRS